MSFLAELHKYLPGVKKPEKRLTFKEKLIWTLGILIIYFIMSHVPIFGISPTELQRFQTFEIILGSTIGSLITLGIGPIVSASIILQLLVGSKIIPWDLSKHEDRAKFQGMQKLLAYLFALFEAFAFVAMGAIVPVNESLFLPVILQIAAGAWAIIFMDEIVSKWGFGSGVGLFIVGGVAKRIVVVMFSPVVQPTGAFVGAIPEFIRTLTIGSPDFLILVPVIFTVIIFAISVYAQSMRVEIPLTFGNVRGFGRKWPIKFIYTSVLPVILISALLANLSLLANFLSQKGVDYVIGNFHLIGNYVNGVPSQNSLMYYLTAPRNFILNLFTMNVGLNDVLRVITYTLVYVLGAVIFSIFWVRTSGQDPETIAEQIHSIGMQIPGFRRDKRIITKILNRYISALAVMGGAFIGFLAAFANWTNAIGTGTGILLAVMITFQLYEELAKQHMEDMHPLLRKFIK